MSRARVLRLATYMFLLATNVLLLKLKVITPFDGGVFWIGWGVGMMFASLPTSESQPQKF